jgi:hypothetical protein
MPKIFINFRNGDSDWAAELLAEKLAQRFGECSIFKSNKSIPLGEPWPNHLREAARACDVLLALVGPAWLTITGEDGRPRIFDDDDWVRREIGTALAAGRTVAAIRLGNTPRLSPEDLPEDIRELANRQGWRLDRRQFSTDYAGLEKELMEVVPGLRTTADPGPYQHGITVDAETVAGNVKDSLIIGASVPSGTSGLNLRERLRASANIEGSVHIPLEIRNPDRGKGDCG